ncbi:NMD3-related protein [Aeropyrum camini]|uniref:NMD3-related protein n=1 Tax=Aeropyrum camini TaxID=229980 RepID=UPI00138EEA55|nr:NMD3-related protein [Aeropyrum camini]
MPGVCPSCGRPLEGKGVRRLCPDCYVERYGVARLPETIRFVYCRDCGAYRYQGGGTRGWRAPRTLSGSTCTWCLR